VKKFVCGTAVRLALFALPALTGFTLFVCTSVVQAEEITTEVAYGLVTTDFNVATRTDPTIQVRFGKPLGNQVEIKIGYQQLGQYNLIDTSTESNPAMKVTLQAASISLMKGLTLSENFEAEYGIGVVRWKETKTYDGGNLQKLSENDLQVYGSLFYAIDSTTKLGFMYSEIDASIANMRTFTCNLKYNLDI